MKRWLMLLFSSDCAVKAVAVVVIGLGSGSDSVWPGKVNFNVINGI